MDRMTNRQPLRSRRQLELSFTARPWTGSARALHRRYGAYGLFLCLNACLLPETSLKTREDAELADAAPKEAAERDGGSLEMMRAGGAAEASPSNTKSTSSGAGGAGSGGTLSMSAGVGSPDAGSPGSAGMGTGASGTSGAAASSSGNAGAIGSPMNTAGTAAAGTSAAGAQAGSIASVAPPPHTFADWPMPDAVTGALTAPSFGTRSGVVIDNVTHLEWQVVLPATYEGCTGKYEMTEAAGTCCTWAEAKQYCRQYGEAQGQTGWRLPTKIELESIVDETRYSPSIDTFYFVGTPNRGFWTDTVYPGSPDQAYYVGFATGLTSYGPITSKTNVRCVR
jgi:hypothetical protein